MYFPKKKKIKVKYERMKLDMISYFTREFKFINKLCSTKIIFYYKCDFFFFKFFIKGDKKILHISKCM